MLKRILIATVFTAVFGAAGLGMGRNAGAWDDCSYGYRSSYYPAYATAYYPTYYGYGPSVAVYRSPVTFRDYRVYDHRRGHHHDDHHDRSHVTFSFGF